jgi:GDPmannose 4,6-dehydratase
VSEAFGYAGLDWKQYVVLDDTYKRPAEVELLQGDASKAERNLGWKPKIRFRELVHMMVDADANILRQPYVI